MPLGRGLGLPLALSLVRGPGRLGEPLGTAGRVGWLMVWEVGRRGQGEGGVADPSDQAWGNTVPGEGETCL